MTVRNLAAVLTLGAAMWAGLILAAVSLWGWLA